MKYIWKNIRSFFRRESGLFALCILCIFLSLQMMLAAYGLFGCYTVKKLAKEQNLSSIEYTFTEDVTKEEFAKAIQQVPQELNDKVFSYHIEVSLAEEYPDIYWDFLRFAVCVQDGKIKSSKGYLKNTGLLDNYFTEEQDENGELVAMVCNDKSNSHNDDFLKMNTDGETVEILGQRYRIVGFQNVDPVIVPFLSLKDDTVLDREGSISLYEPVTKKDYETFRTIFTRELDGKVAFPDLEIPDLNELYRYNTILLVNLFIIVASAINFALLYKYMLMKRRGTLAIFRVCGMRKGRAAFLYLGECLAMVLPAGGAALGCFHFWVLPALAGIYENIRELYTPAIYGKLLGGYLAVTVVMLLAVIGLELRIPSLTLWMRGKRYE